PSVGRVLADLAAPRRRRGHGHCAGRAAPLLLPALRARDRQARPLVRERSSPRRSHNQRSDPMKRRLLLAVGLSLLLVALAATRALAAPTTDPTDPRNTLTHT